MDYVEVKEHELAIGQVYTDMPPDAKHLKPLKMQFVEKDSNSIAFKNVSDFNRYIPIDGLIWFKLDGGIYYKEIIY